MHVALYVYLRTFVLIRACVSYRDFYSRSRSLFFCLFVRAGQYYLNIVVHNTTRKVQTYNS